MTTKPPATEKMPDESTLTSEARSQISDAELSSFEKEFEDTADGTRRAVRERLYAHKKPAEKANKSPPKIDQMDYKLLEEHVRLLNGKPPRLVRKPKLACWMDSPEIAPKMNRTTAERNKFIVDRLEDRKDSEEDIFSARCAN